MKILPVSGKLRSYLKRRNLENKFQKQTLLLKDNLKHPGLNVELLEPHEMRIFSFRVDKKYRALFFLHEKKNIIEIFKITDHYQ